MTARLVLIAAALASSGAAAPAAPGGPATLDAAAEAAAFQAGGFTRQGGRWKACDDPTAGYTPGAVQSVADLNGDGRPEAILVEGGTFCYGHTGAGYVLVSQQADGRWRKMAGGIGIVSVLATRGAGGWPDLEVGGPGFCFPVLRFNGKAYALHRHQYEGKPCKAR